MNFTLPTVVMGPDAQASTDDYRATWMRLDPDKLYDKLVLVWPLSWLLILPGGLWANAINVRTFYRMGLDDTVAILFFVLALVDFAQLFFPLASMVAMALIFVEKNSSTLFNIQPLAVFIYATNVSLLFNTWTCLITAFLSVQRSLCIFLPFQFKVIFTKSRTCFIMVLFGAYSAIPAFAYLFITYEVLPMSLSSNRTQLVLMLKPSYRPVQKYADFVYMGTSVSCQVLSLGSLIVMAWALSASVRFRQNMAFNTTRDETRIAHGYHEGKRQNTESSKERTAVIQVSLLAAIYLITSLPRIAFAIGSFSVPEYGLNKEENNLYLFGFFLRLTFDYVNSAVNFFVYYRYNSRFRKFCFGKFEKKAT